MGKVATVPDDVSPLRIGTRGTHDDKSFEIVGRIRWRWSGGGWNEWVMMFDNGVQAWLGDAMGRYMLLFEYPGAGQKSRGFKSLKIVKSLAQDEPVEPGQQSTIDGTEYEVADIKDVECVGSEGELPFATPVGLTVRSVDLIRKDGQCACVQKDRGQISVYRGHYLDLAALHPVNLRPFEGWSMPVFAQ